MNRKILLRTLALVTCLLCSLGAAAAEAYACYTSADSTLTFYYDNQRASRAGTTYDLPTIYNSSPAWYSDGTYQSITQAVFDPSFAGTHPTRAAMWFYSMQNLRSITGMAEYLNTDEVTSMYYMFGSCKSLTSIDVSNFNTAKVTNMDGMFCECFGLTSLDVSSFNTAKVRSMEAMFSRCTSLQNLDLSNFNTSNVTNMRYMFEGSSGLQSLDLSSFNTANVTDVYGMFMGCSGLTSLNLSSFNTENMMSMSNMFNACSSLTSLNLSSFNTANVLSMSCMFDHCSSLTSLNLSNFNTVKVKNMSNMFNVCSSMTNLVLGDFNNAAATDMSYMFKECSGLTSLDLSNFNTPVVTNMSYMFYHCSGLTSIDVNHFNTANVTDLSYMFASCSGLTDLDLSSFNTANGINMAGMFANCSSLAQLDVSNFNTANVTKMNSMFASCSSLTSLDLSSFNTTNVNNVTTMFNHCNNLVTILAGSGWNVESVTAYNSLNMFSDCPSLVGGMGTTYDVDHVNAAYAHIDGGPSNPGYLTDINAPSDPEAYACYTSENTTLTFYYDKLRSIREGKTYDLNTGTDYPTWYFDGTNSSVTQVVFDPSFADARPETTAKWFSEMLYLDSIVGMAEYLNTSDVTDMSRMFFGCYSLSTIDLSNFNTANVESMADMFRNCQDLIILDLTSFNTSQVTKMDKMFQNNVFLTTIYAGDGWSTDAVTSSSLMFDYCFALVGSEGTTYDSNHIDAEYAHIDGGPINPGYFTDPNAPEAYACYTPLNTTLTFYCDHQRNDRVGTTYDLGMDYDEPQWFTDGTNSSVTQVVFDPSFADAYPRSTFMWFSEMVNLQSIEGIEYLNTSNVTNMVEMFFNCSALTSLDVSGFNTAYVTEMTWMFGYCYQLTSLDVSGFDTHNVTDMGAMFSDCYELTGIDLNNFNTSNVINLSEMFYGCSSLTSLDLSNFNTSNVIYLSGMFCGCSSLTSLDLSSFNTAKVIYMDSMFDGCSNLSTIYGGDGWTTDALKSSTNMFYNCTSIRGGMGTTYDANHVDAAYAHIDGGTANPGYFTAKVDFLRGDVNGDGQVKISDVTALINYLLSGDASAINLQAADCNEDGQIKISDVTALINYLLSGTW